MGSWWEMQPYSTPLRLQISKAWICTTSGAIPMISKVIIVVVMYALSWNQNLNQTITFYSFYVFQIWMSSVNSRKQQCKIQQQGLYKGFKVSYHGITFVMSYNQCIMYETQESTPWKKIKQILNNNTSLNSQNQNEAKSRNLQWLTPEGKQGLLQCNTMANQGILRVNIS